MVPETQDIADVMVLPIKKGFSSTSVPSKLPAYMFSAKPVIAAVDFNGDTSKSIRDSNCGWVCEPENIYELSKTMIIAEKTSNKKLKEMGSMGYDYAIENFSRKKNLPKLSDIFENLLTAK